MIDTDYLPFRLMLWLTALLLFVACSPSEQAQVQTAVAPIAQTALAEGQEVVATEAAKFEETVITGIGTEAAEQAATLAASVGTGAAQSLTPDPPEIMATPRPEDIVTYTVEEEDNLSMIAHRFDTTTERLIELNAGQYPSLLDTPNYVEVGWVIIVAIEPPATPVPIPTPFSNTPGCDVSNIYWLESPITCQRYTVELVTDVSLSIACVVLDDNPLGYYKTVTIKEGWYLIDNRGVHSYTWLVDKERNEVVIGPAILTDEMSYPECGLPGNP